LLWAPADSSAQAVVRWAILATLPAIIALRIAGLV
jgi:hypothetical protein